MRIRSVFWGTPNFTLPVARTLKDKTNLTGVVTKPNSPIEHWAQRNRIDTLRFAEEKDSIPPADLFVVAAYGKILPPSTIELPTYNTLNLHPSLLPKLRGPSPVKTAILQGDDVTGISIIRMTPKMDAGPIVAQAQIPLQDQDTAPEVLRRLFLLGSKLLEKIMPLWIQYQEDPAFSGTEDIVLDGLPSTGRTYFPPKKQDESRVSLAPKINKEDGKINWRENTEKIWRKFRAFKNWPHVWTTIGKLAEVMDFDCVKLDSQIAKKKVEIIDAHLSQSGDLEVLKVKVEGKSTVSWQDFVNGYLQEAKSD